MFELLNDNNGNTRHQAAMHEAATTHRPARRPRRHSVPKPRPSWVFARLASR